MYNRLATPLYPHKSTKNPMHFGKQKQNDESIRRLLDTMMESVYEQNQKKRNVKKKMDQIAVCIMYHVEGMQRQQLQVKSNNVKR